MARRMAKRQARPGIIFILILVIAVVILYLSWNSMMGSKNNSVDDAYDKRNQQGLLNLPHKGNNNWNVNHPSHILENPVQGGLRSSLSSTERTFEKSRGKVQSKNYISTNGKEKNIDAHVSESPNVSVPYYFRSHVPSKLVSKLESMEKLVHLDLKGAAPKVSYFKELFPLLNKLGATGLLIEYEDTFPYNATLKHLAAGNAYSREDIYQILSLAKQNGLTVMPLIQTFGHMEFVLKHEEMKGLRESAHTPQVVASTMNGTYPILAEMIKQVLDAHPDVTHVHIGCDEVYELGRGLSKDTMVKNNVTAEHVFLNHVRHVAELVKQYSSDNHRKSVRPVIWDDELRKIPAGDITKFSLHTLVEIMVWAYTPEILPRVTNAVWEKYSQLFRRVWIASSFKGATGPRQFYTNPTYHIQNHFSWLNIMIAYGESMEFVGVALTGWQRYDHFATLCELLPTALPTLAVCLATMKHGGFDKKIHAETSPLLRCSNLIEMTIPEIDPKTKQAHVSQDCRFPGSPIYYALQQFYGYTMRQSSITGRMDGWLSDYQVAHGFSNPGQLKVLITQIDQLNTDYLTVSKPLEHELSAIYSNDTVDEWLEENIFERIRKNNVFNQKVKMLLEKTTWKSRPFSKINMDKQSIPLSAPKVMHGIRKMYDINTGLTIKESDNINVSHTNNLIVSNGNVTSKSIKPESNIKYNNITNTANASTLKYLEVQNNNNLPVLPNLTKSKPLLKHATSSSLIYSGISGSDKNNSLSTIKTKVTYQGESQKKILNDIQTDILNSTRQRNSENKILNDSSSSLQRLPKLPELPKLTMQGSTDLPHDEIDIEKIDKGKFAKIRGNWSTSSISNSKLDYSERNNRSNEKETSRFSIDDKSGTGNTYGLSAQLPPDPRLRTLGRQKLFRNEVIKNSNHGHGFHDSKMEAYEKQLLEQ